MSGEGEDTTQIQVDDAPVADSGVSTMAVEDALKEVLRTALIHDGLERGFNRAVKTLDSGLARFAVLCDAVDADEYKTLIEGLCAFHKIPLVKVSDGKKLGEWAGLCKLDREGNPRKSVSCSSLAVKHIDENSPAYRSLKTYFA